MFKKQKAFTLIELMVTVSVLGVVLALAVPGFNKQILNNKSATLGDEFAATLNLARYEAVKRAKRVSVCASSNSTTSTPSCTGNWTEGYIMFVDEATADNATSPVLGSAPTIIKVFEKTDPKAKIDINRDSTAINFIRYTALGNLARISNSYDSIVIDSKIEGCNSPVKARKITINLSGLVSPEKVSCLL